MAGLLVACKSREGAPTAKAEPSGNVPLATASVSAVPSVSAGMKLQPPVASASGRPAAVRVPPEPLSAECKAALARARKLQVDGDYEQAKAEFVRAAGAGDSPNLQPLVELGYMDLTKSGAADEAALFLRAGTRAGDPVLEGQAWYNLSLFYAQSTDVEAERAALARSLAVRDNTTVKAKLGARSRCVAEIGPRNGAPLLTPAVVAGWNAVAEHVGRGSDGSPAEARAAACVECSCNASDPDTSHGCPGAGPWDIGYGYQWYTYNKGFIAQLPQNRFFVSFGRVGTFYQTCSSAPEPSWKQQGAYAIATLEDDEVTPFPGRPVPQEGGEGACLRGPGSTTTAVFALGTAELRGTVTVVAGHPVDVRVDEAAKRIVLSGGGCDGFVALDGKNRLVALGK